MKLAVAGGEISYRYDGPAGASRLIVLAHGAGADMNHEYMDHFARSLSSDSTAVCRFNFLYTERNKKSPDRPEVLEETYRGLVDQVCNERSPEFVVLGGKSMGGRIASQIVASGQRAEGLLFLGYPLHPPGKPDRMRAAHLSDAKVPMLFVEGTRDPFCPLETLERVISERGLDARLAVIEDGDHSLKVPRSSGRSTHAAWDEAVAAIEDWLVEVTPD